MLERMMSKVLCREYVTASRTACPRRRGSALILVMTLLGILFVTGVVFLKTMSFEARIISAEQEQERDDAGIGAVFEELGTILRQGMVDLPGTPFGDAPLGTSLNGYAELPGVHNLFAPIEPYWTSASPPQLVFEWLTDVNSLINGPHDGSWLRNLKSEQVNSGAAEGINTTWLSGVEQSFPPPPNTAITIYPVDSDGDGVTDTLQFPIRESATAQGLGFSNLQIEELAEQLNIPTNPGGQVYLGLRIVAHGGLVNLNESHPELIKSALGLPQEYLLTYDPDPRNWGFYFSHSPTRSAIDDQPGQRWYSPWLEEATLRRRVLLPPRVLLPSLLHGNPHLNPETSPDTNVFGGADMPTKLFPPLLDDPYDFGFETVYEGRHRYTPFSMQMVAGNWVDPYKPGDPNSPPLWAVRMEPFTDYNYADKLLSKAYDRRHLVTTVSYDGLLSRGAWWHGFDAAGNPTRTDILEKMHAANLAADDPAEACNNIYVPFEYPDYPHSIVDNCNCPTRPTCRFDQRKGRLLLSLPWLDKLTDPVIREHLIHDVFMMLLMNARGPYWDPITNIADCTADDSLEWDYVRLVCVDRVLRQPRRWARISRTAASLTANLLDFMDFDLVCRGGSKDGVGCHTDGDCYACVGGSYGLKPCTTDDDCPGGNCNTAPTCVSECYGGSNAGQPCRTDSDCSGGVCLDQNIPTRVALRSFDFDEKRCAGGADAGQLCTANADCDNRTCLTTAGWEFGTGKCNGGPNDAQPCLTAAECPYGGTCDAWLFPVQYVYGLERQPYITEVATAADGDHVVARAVEIFNPYDVDIAQDADGDGISDYWLAEGDPRVPSIPLNYDLPAGKFAVIRTDLGNAFLLGASGSAIGTTGWVYDASPPLGLFENGWTIYLVRRITYPGDATATNIVVDQFTVNGANIGKADPRGGSTSPPYGPDVYAMQRMVPDPTVPPLRSIWTATVPDAGEGSMGTHNLGGWNTHTNTNIRPVEVNFANMGRFGTDPTYPSDVGTFPTTGSLLLLMRHANRSSADYDPAFPDRNLAFTAWLDDVTTWVEIDPATGAAVQRSLSETTQIDNGRMPVFDVGEVADPNPLLPLELRKRYAHHVHPATGACCLPSPAPCVETIAPLCPAGVDFWLGATCTTNACTTKRDMPGDLPTLPWGQLVFDYFTALPLSSPGPYGNPTGDRNFAPARADSIPRVDLNGLRVHGRININAAPWTVLSGLPLVPRDRLPAAFRFTTKRFALNTTLCVGGLHHGAVCEVDADCDRGTCPPIPAGQAIPIGQALAQAIVAYREARAVDDGSGENRTGDYGTGAAATGMIGEFPHGWDVSIPPLVRRGTGFMTVGELANVRHLGASSMQCILPEMPPCSVQPIDGYNRYSFYRVDAGMIADGATDLDYVSAIALLVSLGDWVTVRSDVFTIYGTLRGEGDRAISDDVQRARDVDTRALRFQETVDRLPVFLGEAAPVVIGERVLTKYVDVRND
jgi:hypothetical protein